MKLIYNNNNLFSSSKPKARVSFSDQNLSVVDVVIVQWFWRRRFLNFINVFRNHLPLEKSRALYFNNLESPSPKNALCQNWLKLDQWFWRRKFSKFLNVFFTISHLTPLWEGCGPTFGQTWIPSSKDAFCQVRLKLDQWLWRRRFLKVVNVFLLFCIYYYFIRRWKCEKFTGRRTGGQTKGDQKSSLELSAQVS